MEALVDKGLVSHLGVANFSALKLQDLLATCRIQPAVVQVRSDTFKD
jgi:diketogulonate reductase-like aldo/keto reductase